MSGDDGGEIIKFDSGPYDWGQAADTPPPPTVPDAPPPVLGPLDAAYAALVEAANSDDPANDAQAASDQASRAAKYADTLAKFPANDDQSVTTLTQPIAQAMSAAMGAIAGAGAGIIAPLTAVAEAVAQAGAEAMQTGLGALSSAAAPGDPAGDYEDDGDYNDYGGGGKYDDVGDYSGDGGGGGGSSSSAGDGGVAALPATFLPPLAGPAPTFPAAAPPPATAPAQPQTAGQPGMGGMAPMPMATGGVGGGNDKNAEMKRLQPPTITNGRPVMGRFTPDRLDRAPIVTRVRRVNLKKASEGDKDKEEG